MIHVIANFCFLDIGRMQIQTLYITPIWNNVYILKDNFLFGISVVMAQGRICTGPPGQIYFLGTWDFIYLSRLTVRPLYSLYFSHFKISNSIICFNKILNMRFKNIRDKGNDTSVHILWVVFFFWNLECTKCNFLYNVHYIFSILVIRLNI